MFCVCVSFPNLYIFAAIPVLSIWPFRFNKNVQVSSSDLLRGWSFVKPRATHTPELLHYPISIRWAPTKCIKNSRSIRLDSCAATESFQMEKVLFSISLQRVWVPLDLWQMESYVPYTDIQFSVNQKTPKYTWHLNYSAQKSIIVWEFMRNFRILQSLWNIIMNMSYHSACKAKKHQLAEISYWQKASEAGSHLRRQKDISEIEKMSRQVIGTWGPKEQAVVEHRKQKQTFFYNRSLWIFQSPTLGRGRSK